MIWPPPPTPSGTVWSSEKGRNYFYQGNILLPPPPTLVAKERGGLRAYWRPQEIIWKECRFPFVIWPWPYVPLTPILGGGAVHNGLQLQTTCKCDSSFESDPLQQNAPLSVRHLKELSAIFLTVLPPTIKKKLRSVDFLLLLLLFLWGYWVEENKD